jgi:N-carbamoyl-L-amino-acid hydrolase
MVQINAEHFLADLHELRKIGAYKTGVHRPTFSPQDMESRHWLIEKLRECGLEASIDGIGNIYGRHKGPGPHLLVGSHIESQNYAGWLDGALGVMAGVALARAGLPVDVAAFADEEGHFEGGFLGSRSIIGELTEEEIDRSRSRNDGTPLRDALAAAGLAGKPRLQLEPGRHKGFYEMHIEQGTQLESASTWTTGRISLDPGAPSIIPGSADVLFQFRDVSVPVLERMEAGLRALVQESNRREKCPATLTQMSRATPAICDPAMMAALEQAAEAHAPGLWQQMPSGAGHDAQYIARRMPASMIFVPSIGGISHHWAEDTKDEDLALGCQVLASAAEKFLAG